ncbi:MAG: hypothetical protein ACHP84_00785 [Caulobacterales bacterium]
MPAAGALQTTDGLNDGPIIDIAQHGLLPGPAAARAVVIPRPMPDAAPVTKAVLPARSFTVRSSFDCAGHYVVESLTNTVEDGVDVSGYNNAPVDARPSDVLVRLRHTTKLFNNILPNTSRIRG